MMLFKKDKDKTGAQVSKERRKHERINKSYVLRYFLRENPAEKFEITQLKNISMGGMCFVTTEAYPPNSTLGIELKTPYVSETTYLEGRVLQSHEKAGSMLYQTRVEFYELNDHAKLLLSKIISSTSDRLG